jgi:hypothetical protein
MFVNITLTMSQYAPMGLPLPPRSGADVQWHQANRKHGREKVTHHNDNIGKV